VSGGNGYFKNIDRAKDLSSFKHERETKRDGNGQWNFHKCKGIAVNEKNKGGRKAFKHKVLIQVELLFCDEAL
jgi:hypothetical protein